MIGGGSAVVTEKGDGLKMSTSPEKRSESFATPHLTHSASFLEQHPLTTHVPIPEEDEDETSSEPAEAITPTTDSHPPFHHGIDGLTDFPHKPLMVNTPANVMLRDAAQISNKPLPTSAPTSQPSKPASKSIRALFRRSNSHATDQITYNPLNASSLTAASPMAVQSSRRKLSYSASHSPATSQSNTPPSPSSPTSTVHSSSEKAWEPAALKKGARSSTGLSLKIGFGHTPKPPRSRKRSSSVNNFSHLLPQHDDFSRPAETGAGLKARRMSISLPDDFIVDAIELDEEFTSASRLPGKRGKFIGKGATATVKLMTRKGAGDEVYAVKEFRKRGQHEDPEEYDKKVKSEYTIAKSLHHPNIVESVRLCTHAGRWNVVMEYCQYGELFSLVEKKYLDMDSKLCLWKQLLRGVSYLHNHGIAHRDIKLENLLMNDKGHLKITDFGVSDVFCGEHPGVREAGGECGKNMKEVRRSAPGICGSLPYIAPEVLAKNGNLSISTLQGSC
jgi:protein-serine/threonine kinase